MVFGIDPGSYSFECVLISQDERIMLDLCSSTLGERGLGGEVFAMERVNGFYPRKSSNCCDKIGVRQRTEGITFTGPTVTLDHKAWCENDQSNCN